MGETGDGEPGSAESPSEMLYLPNVGCPSCGQRDIVVQIELGRTPVLTCVACGHTSDPRPGS